jgi:hypothetical protein
MAEAGMTMGGHAGVGKNKPLYLIRQAQTALSRPAEKSVFPSGAKASAVIVMV